MSDKYLKTYFFLLFSLIPISIIVGPAVSLTNILLIDMSFIAYVFYKKEYKFLSNKTVRLLIILYLYLILNSIMAQEFLIGANRNIGFIRFIILFVSFNYFFYHIKFFDKIFIIWFITLIVLCLDVYIESFTGKNILGYGGVEYGSRIVSFFKDEPIVGGYINGFYLLIIGYIYTVYKEYPGKYKIFLLFLSLFIFSAILLTGERSNTIKALIGFILFFLINDNLKFQQKIFSIFSIIIAITILYIASDFLKLRYSGQIFDSHYKASPEYLAEHNIDKTITKEKIVKYYNENLYFRIYRSGYNVFRDHKLFGAGNKNYRIETCEKTTNNIRYYCTTHPHQTYFEFLAEHGLIGSLILLFIFFNLIFGQFKNILISKNNLQLGGFIYLLILFLPILPSGAFFNDYNLTIFWVNLSLMYAVDKKSNIFNII